MTPKKSFRAWMKRTKRISPQYFLLIAALILAVFTILHLAGARENLSILSGTLPDSGASQFRASFWAVLYLLLYLAATLLAPILILGAGIFWGMSRLIKYAFPSLRGAQRRSNDGGGVI